MNSPVPEINSLQRHPSASLRAGSATEKGKTQKGFLCASVSLR
jgi:hypothetical protein